MKEIWKDVINFETYYQVSNKGRVRSLDKNLTRCNGTEYFRKGIIRKQYIADNGYHKVNLRKNGKVYIFLVHRLLMEAFHGVSELHVNHINGNKSDNTIDNLEFVTHLENMNHASTKLKGKKKYGVRLTPYGRWRAEIRIGDKKKHLGNFICKDKAHSTFYRAYKKLHGVTPW